MTSAAQGNSELRHSGIPPMNENMELGAVADANPGHDADNTPFEVVHRRKRARELSHLQGPETTSQPGRPTTTGPMTRRNSHRAASAARLKVIGRNSAANSKLKASTTVAEKAVFSVSNVSSEYEPDNIRDYLSENGIIVVSCFSAKTKYADSKSFRVCIAAKDRDRFLSPELWPENVILKDWFFKVEPN